MDRATAKINLSALKHNFSVLKQQSTNSKVIAMIKANAYGHGSIAVAQSLNEADAFGVACIEEAIVLRKAGITQPILIMSAFLTAEQLKEVQDYQLSLVIHNEYQLKLLEDSPWLHAISVWMKIDTGMHRLGFTLEESPEIFQRLQKCSNIRKPFGVMTHFADADNSQKETVDQQLQKFNQLVKNWSCEISLANSAAILMKKNTCTGWIRPGLLLYGVSPVLNTVASQFNLQPVMTLSAKLVSKKIIKKNEAVGYGGTWICPEDMLVGVVSIGYADGYPRHAKNGTPTLVGQKECPLIGRVSMDLLTIDLRNATDAKINDEVILWGEDLPVEIIAKSAETIPYELLCHVGNRVNHTIAT